MLARHIGILRIDGVDGVRTLKFSIGNDRSVMHKLNPHREKLPLILASGVPDFRFRDGFPR